MRMKTTGLCAAAAALSLALLSGCSLAPDYGAAASRQLQADVLEVTQLSVDGDFAEALDALDALSMRLTALAFIGAVEPAQQQEIEEAIANLRAYFERTLRDIAPTPPATPTPGQTRTNLPPTQSTLDPAPSLAPVPAPPPAPIPEPVPAPDSSSAAERDPAPAPAPVPDPSPSQSPSLAPQPEPEPEPTEPAPVEPPPPTTPAPAPSSPDPSGPAAPQPPSPSAPAIGPPISPAPPASPEPPASSGPSAPPDSPA